MQLDIQFTIPGIPRPQGSKKHIGKGRMIEVSKFVANWRAFVSLKASEAMQGKQIVGKSRPVAIRVEYYFDRPKTHFNRQGLRHDAPLCHTSRPDVDKLLRATLDGLTGIVFLDDAQVSVTGAAKFYGQQALTEIWVTA